MIPGNVTPLLLTGDDAYRVERSLRIRTAANSYLSRTYSGYGTDRRIRSIMIRCKRGGSGVRQNIISCNDGSANNSYISFESNDTLRVDLGTDAAYPVTTAQAFRDFAAWYHILIVIDTTQAVAADRIKIWNGFDRISGFSTASYPPLNMSSNVFVSGATNRIGAWWNGTLSSDLIFADVTGVDGTALTPDAFGMRGADDNYIPKKYNDVYGANGFHLEFKDNSAATAAAIGKDTSGNGNDWTPTNITLGSGNRVLNDSLIDVPTNYSDGVTGRGNYPGFNALQGSGALPIYGNMSLTGGFRRGLTQLFPKTGKWYVELICSGTAANVDFAAGVASGGLLGTTHPNPGASIYFSDNLYMLVNSTTTAGPTGGIKVGDTDTVQIAFDADTGSLFLGRNDVYYTAAAAATGSPANGVNPTTILNPALDWQVIAYTTTNNVTCFLNAGQQAFSRAVPAGFKALNTQNMPSPSVPRSRTGFDIVLRAGTGAAGAVSNLLFKFGLLWSKCRNAAVSHTLINSVRGAGKGLSANQTIAESSIPNAVTAINDNGYSFASSVGDALEFNTAGRTFVDWLFRKGPVYGFDAIEYVGNGVQRAITHAAGKVPSVVVVKSLVAVSGAGNWPTGHSGIPTNWGNEYLYLDAQDKATGSGVEFMWGNPVGIPPTSTTVTLGTSKQCNQDGTPYVMFVWSEVPGFSKFGSYGGNSSADGPFVHCDFEPALVILKCYNVAGTNWVIKDNRRSGINPADGNLYSNSSLAEDLTASVYVDLVSNGFKIRGNYASINSGSSFVYMAFAANPFKTARAR